MPKYDIGRYEASITGQGFKEASTGTIQFFIQFDVMGKVDPKDPNSLIAVAPGNRTIYRALTEKTVEWVMDDLKALGVEGLQSWQQLDPNAERADFIDLTGRQFDAMCGRDNSSGKDYEDWSVARSGSGGGKPIEAAPAKKVAALDRLFGKGLVKPAAAAAGSRRAPQPAATAVMDAPITDEDVPF